MGIGSEGTLFSSKRVCVLLETLYSEKVFRDFHKVSLSVTISLDLRGLSLLTVSTDHEKTVYLNSLNK